MHAVSRHPPLESEHAAVIVSLAELNRARSLRVLDRWDDDAPTETHPWAYGFPRRLVSATND